MSLNVSLPPELERRRRVGQAARTCRACQPQEDGLMKALRYTGSAENRPKDGARLALGLRVEF